MLREQRDLAAIEDLLKGRIPLAQVQGFPTAPEPPRAVRPPAPPGGARVTLAPSPEEATGADVEIQRRLRAALLKQLPSETALSPEALAAQIGARPFVAPPGVARRPLTSPADAYERARSRQFEEGLRAAREQRLLTEAAGQLTPASVKEVELQKAAQELQAEYVKALGEAARGGLAGGQTPEEVAPLLAPLLRQFGISPEALKPPPAPAGAPPVGSEVDLGDGRTGRILSYESPDVARVEVVDPETGARVVRRARIQRQ
jgi:hypothetical protein